MCLFQFVFKQEKKYYSSVYLVKISRLDILCSLHSHDKFCWMVILSFQSVYIQNASCPKYLKNFLFQAEMLFQVAFDLGSVQVEGHHLNIGSFILLQG